MKVFSVIKQLYSTEPEEQILSIISEKKKKEKKKIQTRFIQDSEGFLQKTTTRMTILHNNVFLCFA
jgi:hypothetical protein